MSLSSLIVQREIATIRQVEEALARQVLYGGDLVTNLLEVARLDEGTLTVLLAESFGLPPATPGGPLPAPTTEARDLVPPEMADARAMMPIEVAHGALIVAVAEPLPKEGSDDIAYSIGMKIEQRVAPMVRVREALARAYGTPLERRLQRLLARLSGAEVGVVSGSSPARSLNTGEPPARTPLETIPFLPGSALPPEALPTGAFAPVPLSRRATQTGFGAVNPPAAAAPAPSPPKDAARPALVPSDGAQARPARRRRGPLLPEAAKKELEQAEGRDAILDLFFDFARQYFAYSAIFVVHGDIAEGRDAYGDGASRERVTGIGVPLDLPSVLASARDAKRPLSIAPTDDGLDPVLLSDLQCKTTAPVLVVPIVVKRRTVALLFGDSGPNGPDPEAERAVADIALAVGQAFERVIVKKKLHGFIAGTGAPASARVESERVPPKVSERPPPVIVPAPQSIPEPSPPPPASEPIPEAPVSLPDPVLPPPPPARPHVSEMPTVETDLSLTRGLLQERPPPPTAAAVYRPSGRPIPREDPGSDRPTPVVNVPEGTPTAPMNEPPIITERVDTPPPSSSISVAPRKPPSSTRASSSEALPSVIVDVDSELGALVDRVIAAGADETAESELLRQGPAAMPAIMARFPGPITVDRARVEDGGVRAADCGPVLRLVAAQRRAAVPFVLPIVGDGDPDRRYWATFLLTELAYADCVDALIPRLFESELGVRRVARLAARAVAEIAPEPMIDRLARFYRDPSLHPARRVEAIEALGELRERIVVPLLIEALGDEDEEAAAAARRALMIVTRQDFGRDVKRWQAWWGQNGARHRIEWLIEALMHEVPVVRRAAGEELKALTKEYFGYYDDLPRRERERAQQRYRDWWATEGRTRFQRR